jgi:exodeoxyribonuclease VII small subunit
MNEINPQGEQLPTFEEAYRRLEEISRRLEDGSTPLELSFKLFEEGQALIGLCQKMLDNAEKRIKILKSGSDGITSEDMVIA